MGNTSDSPSISNLDETAIPTVDLQVLHAILGHRGKMSPLEKRRATLILGLVDKSPAWKDAYRIAALEEARSFVQANPHLAE